MKNDNRSYGTRVIAFLGMSGGCGTTTLAVSTARAFSQCGKQVLYVDCNIDFPHAYRYFKLKEEDCNNRFIDNVNILNISVESLVLPTDDKRIKLITSNPIGTMGESANKDNFYKMLEMMEHSFDIVILDCDSTLYSELTFAGIKLSTNVYGVLDTRPQLLINTMKKKKFIKEIIGKDKLGKVIINKAYSKELPDNLFEGTGVEVIGNIRYSEIIEHYGNRGKDIISNGCKGYREAEELKRVASLIVSEVGIN